MGEWSRAFDCPIYLHVADRQWVMRPDPAIEFWLSGLRKIKDALGDKFGLVVSDVTGVKAEDHCWTLGGISTGGQVGQHTCAEMESTWR